MLSYIYKYTNKENGMVYIGQSINPKQRYIQHLSGDSYFDQQLRKIGIDNFTYEIIDTATLEEIDNKEVYWIAYYDSFHNGYNRTAGGAGTKLLRTVYCLELNLTFPSLLEAANALNCYVDVSAETVHIQRRIRESLNSFEETAYGFHFCDIHLKDMYIEDLQQFGMIEKIL